MQNLHPKLLHVYKLFLQNRKNVYFFEKTYNYTFFIFKVQTRRYQWNQNKFRKSHFWRNILKYLYWHFGRSLLVAKKSTSFGKSSFLLDFKNCGFFYTPLKVKNGPKCGSFQIYYHFLGKLDFKSQNLSKSPVSRYFSAESGSKSEKSHILKS